jgi:hypothetical protein
LMMLAILLMRILRAAVHRHGHAVHLLVVAMDVRGPVHLLAVCVVVVVVVVVLLLLLVALVHRH